MTMEQLPKCLIRPSDNMLFVLDERTNRYSSKNDAIYTNGEKNIPHEHFTFENLTKFYGFIEVKTKFYKVPLWEYESGWGSKLDDYALFLNEEEAKQFITEFNSKNDKTIVPDWYMIAKDEIVIENIDTKYLPYLSLLDLTKYEKEFKKLVDEKNKRSIQNKNKELKQLLNEKLKEPDFLENICLSYRHDYGLLSDEAKYNLMAQGRDWLISIIKNL